MATVPRTQKKKALRGVIRDVQHNCTVSLVSADIEGRDTPIESEMPKEECMRLNLRIGDEVAIFPLDVDTYLMIGKSQAYRSN